MREFIDSLDGCTVGLPAFDYWHKPQNRVYNGVEVKGRETRGYGDRSFRYAGKKMHPSPWESNEDVAWFKKVAEHHASEELGRNIEFTFCLFTSQFSSSLQMLANVCLSLVAQT